MSRKSIATAIVVSLAFTLGLAAGQQWELRQFRQYESMRASGELRFSLDALSLLEIDEPEKLKRVLEWKALAGVHFAHGREWQDLGQLERESLLIAKAWFEKLPAPHMPESAVAALAAVPEEPLDPEACSPATMMLLGRLEILEDEPSETASDPRTEL
jgi:hypothetical protein